MEQFLTNIFQSVAVDCVGITLKTFEKLFKRWLRTDFLSSCTPDQAETLTRMQK